MATITVRSRDVMLKHLQQEAGERPMVGRSDQRIQGNDLSCTPASLHLEAF